MSQLGPGVFLLFNQPAEVQAGFKNPFPLIGMSAVAVSGETFSGGYEHHPWAYRPRKRYKTRDKEEEKAAEVVAEVAERVIVRHDDTSAKDLEIALRINLQLEGLIYKKIYLKWLKQEAQKFIEFKAKQKRRREEEEIILLLLH